MLANTLWTALALEEVSSSIFIFIPWELKIHFYFIDVELTFILIDVKNTFFMCLLF